MKISICENAQQVAQEAAAEAALELKKSITRNGATTFMAATGLSQIEFLEELSRQPDIEWAKTTMFHLDEYIGLPQSHPASFRRYIQDRIVNRVHPGKAHLIDGSAVDPQGECHRLNRLIANCSVDVAFLGIGENGHLAFNDPPADFDTDEAFIVVDLAKECQQQQLNEGWFNTLAEVPTRAISATIRQIMKSEYIICLVLGTRKAEVVKRMLDGKISPSCPASILRTHANVHLYLDKQSASLLDKFSVGQHQLEPESNTMAIDSGE